MACTEEQEQHLKEKYQAVLEDGEPLDKLRAYVMLKGSNSIRSIARLFKRVDDMGDKKIDFEELWWAVQEYGLDMDKAEVQEAFQAMDQDGSGTVNFDEFLVALRPPLSESRLEMIDAAFDKFDKGGDGKVTIEDLKGVYSAEFHPKYISGEWTEDEVLQNWLDQFTDESGDYEITKEDFVNYYTGVSASIDEDEYFEEMMKSAWKLE